MKVLGVQLLNKWCKLMHPTPMWPVKGYYRCPVCLRSHPVPWEKRPEAVRAPVVVLAARKNEVPLRASSSAATVAVAATR